MSFFEQTMQGAGGSGVIAVSASWYVSMTDGTNIIGTSSHPLYVTGGTGAANGASGQVSVTTTATQIVAARSTRRSVKVTNLGTTDVWLGFTSSVTTSTGDLLVGTKGAFVSIPSNTTIYGIVGSGSQSVSFLEVYD